MHAIKYRFLPPGRSRDCFDLLLLNDLIQPFQQPERVLSFFNPYRHGTRVTRKTLTEIVDQFQGWLKNRAEKWGAPLLEPPEGEGNQSQRDKFLDPYFQNAKPNQVVAILKAREPARILVAIGDKDNNSPHLEYKQRRVNQFNSEIIDHYHNVQQDGMETFIDRGQLLKLAAPTVLPSGRRVPGLKLDHVAATRRHACAGALCHCSAPARCASVSPEGRFGFVPHWRVRMGLQSDFRINWRIPGGDLTIHKKTRSLQD